MALNEVSVRETLLLAMSAQENTPSAVIDVEGAVESKARQEILKKFLHYSDDVRKILLPLGNKTIITRSLKDILKMMQDIF